MQKKIIALAIAGLASSAAFADASNVTLYGRLDYGYANRSGDSGGVVGAVSKSEFAQGIQAGSRLGVKGAEDLGNGLKAIFEVEYGVYNDEAASTSTTSLTAGCSGTSAATWTNRHSYVGLAGGFGTVLGGRLDGVRYGIWNKYDPFTGGTMGGSTQISKGQVDRADNAIAYVSPNMSGFTVLAAYATNIAGKEGGNNPAGMTGAAVSNNLGNQNDLRLNTLMGNYENGPLSLTADYETVKSNDPTGTVYDLSIKVMTLAGSYDFGVAKVSALYDTHKADNRGASIADDRAYMIGALVPFSGSLDGKIQYSKSENKLTADADVSKWGIGLNYKLSKRTMFFTDYGTIHNGINSTTRISSSPNIYASNANSTAMDTSKIGTKGYDIGIAHTF